MLPLLQTTILGQQQIAQHRLGQHFYKHFNSSPGVSPPQNAYMMDAQLSYNKTTNLAPDQYQKYRTHSHLKKQSNGQVCREPWPHKFLLEQKEKELPLRHNVNQWKQNLYSDMIEPGLTQHC